MMWRVEWGVSCLPGLWILHNAFNTEEEANTVMVREVFRYPEYIYRVRFEEEK